MKYICTSLAILAFTANGWLIQQAAAQDTSKLSAGAKAYFWVEEGEYAFLGIYSEQVSKDKAKKLGFDNQYGSYVSRVVNNSAAERAGLQAFDYIFGVDEYRTAEGQDLTQILRRYAPNQRAVIHFIRQREKRKANVVLGRRPSEGQPQRSECERAFLGVSPEGLDVGGLEGVAITTISNSTAESMGLKDGDRITSINGHDIIDWRDIAIAIDNMEVGQTIEVKYQRDGKSRKGSRPIKSHCETKAESQWEVPVAPEPGDWFNRHFKSDEKAPSGIKGPGLSIKAENLTKEEASRIGQSNKPGIGAENNLPHTGLTFYSDNSSNKLHIKCYLPETADTGLRIFNASGRLVYHYSLGQFSGLFSDEVDILQNGDGIYYLEIRQGKRAVSKKITVSGP